MAARYMAVLSAIRSNGELGRFYQGLRKRGKAGKVALVAVALVVVALVAVMRKLRLQLHAIARRGTPWTLIQPQLPSTPTH